LAEAGPASSPASVPTHKGVPKALTDLTLVIPFNCTQEILEDKISSVGGKVAALIMEPIMMNCGIILPEEGFLQMVRRVCTQRGILLVFDEVKTNTTVHRGGATCLYGVTPDIITVGKSVGGGIAVSAIGMPEFIAEKVAQGEPPTCGTFSGNPLAMASVKAMLTEVLDDDVYNAVFALNSLLCKSLQDLISQNNFPAQVVGIGAKGCIIFTTKKVRNYRDYKIETSYEVSECCWYYLITHGVWMAPANEEWTISVQHTSQDIFKFVDVFKDFIYNWKKLFNL